MKENQNDQRNRDKSGNQSNQKATQDGTKKETNPNNPTAKQEKERNSQSQDTVGKGKPNKK